MPEPAEPYKEFIREMTLRIERAVRDMVRESRPEREVILAEIRLQREVLRDLREESRAQTRALLSILDRLENGGAAAG